MTRFETSGASNLQARCVCPAPAACLKGQWHSPTLPTQKNILLLSARLVRRRFDWVAWALPFLLFVGHFDEMEMRQFVARARGFVGVPAFQHLVGGL